MKRLDIIYLFLSLALLVPSLAGCHDDFDFDDNREYQIQTGIVLKIPNIRSMASRAQTRADDPLSRAEANAIADEGGIQENGSARDFWVFIYKTDGTPVEHIQLNAPSSLPSLDDSGKPKYYGYNDGTNTYYEISLDPTSYRVYLVANLSEYVSSTLNWENISESELKELIMDLGSVISSNKANTILKPGHLPMVCMPTDIDGADSSTGLIDITKAEVKELKANLVFQCAKIRYTILFDNNIPDANGNGFSNAGFGNHLLDFNGATIRNVAALTYVDKTQDTPDSYLPASGNPFTAALKPVEYPTDGADYVKPNADPNASVSGDRVTDLTARDPWTATSSKQRAWQGVIYVPENKSKDTKTTMTFAGVVDPKSDGTGINNSYTINLIGPGGNSSTVTSVDPANGTGSAMGSSSHVTIDRGTFYDLTLLAKKMNAFDINFHIEDWTVDQLVYDLHGPYELYVDYTQIEVTSGSVTEIPYHTNADKLEFKSSKYTRADGTKVDVFDIWYDAEKIYVTVNAALTIEELNTIKTDPDVESKYKFFHVNAGNLHKKIIANPLNLDPFLLVTPEEITIDVREQLASGIYGDVFPITVKTNYDSYTISGISWNVIEYNNNNAGNSTNSNQKLVYLATKNGDTYTPVTFNTSRSKPASGTEELYLVYEDLNGGHPFWNDANHTFELNFKATGDSEDHKVKINTKRASDNYVIHFPKLSGWDNPHVYVYQCLEIPGDCKGTIQVDGKTMSLAGMPIGYNKSGDDAYASLEYSFTGKIAFKGWFDNTHGTPNTDGYKSNADWLAEINSYNNKSSGFGYYQGFFEFADGKDYDDANYISWKADASSPQNKRYYKDYDFCAEYRQGLTCGDCKNDNYKRLWPGIQMKDDGNWWTFTLTSTAVPGKALIMFANGHNGDDNKRYPAHAKVGVPLFDYPSREGWFDWDKKAFRPTENQETQVVTEYTCRIYWQQKYNKNDGNGNAERPYIYIWDSGNSALDKKTFRYTGTATISGNVLYYYEFKTTLLPSSLNNTQFIAKKNAGTDNWECQTSGQKVQNFTLSGTIYQSLNTSL